MPKIFLFTLLICSSALAGPKLGASAKRDIYGFKYRSSGNLYHPSKKLTNRYTERLYAQRRINPYKIYSVPGGVGLRINPFGLRYSIRHRF